MSELQKVETFEEQLWMGFFRLFGLLVSDKSVQKCSHMVLFAV